MIGIDFNCDNNLNNCMNDNTIKNLIAIANTKEVMDGLSDESKKLLLKILKLYTLYNIRNMSEKIFTGEDDVDAQELLSEDRKKPKSYI